MISTRSPTNCLIEHHVTIHQWILSLRQIGRFLLMIQHPWGSWADVMGLTFTAFYSLISAESACGTSPTWSGCIFSKSHANVLLQGWLLLKVQAMKHHEFRQDPTSKQTTQLPTVQYAKPVPTELANFTASRLDLSNRSTGLRKNMAPRSDGWKLQKSSEKWPRNTLSKNSLTFHESYQ